MAMEQRRKDALSKLQDREAALPSRAEALQASEQRKRAALEKLQEREVEARRKHDNVMGKRAEKSSLARA